MSATKRSRSCAGAVVDAVIATNNDDIISHPRYLSSAMAEQLQSASQTTDFIGPRGGRVMIIRPVEDGTTSAVALTALKPFNAERGATLGVANVPTEVDVVVVGAGPNGLAAALVMAGAGLSVHVYEAAPTIGGGARTQELTLPGFRHDVCSAVHPMALASPFFRAFDLGRHGVTLRRPEVAYAHPLDGGRAGLAWTDLARTADGLGPDAVAWRTLFAPLVARWEDLAGAITSDFRSIPPQAAASVRLLTRLLEQASPLRGRRFRGDLAPALLAGVGAHAIAPLDRLASTGVGLVLATLAHAVGWPLPDGGSQSIVDAMAAELRRRGGAIATSCPIDSLDQLPRARAVLLDVGPAGLLNLAGDSLPAPYRRALSRYRYGGAACKMDFALSEPVPWAARGCELAGTVHVVGTRAEVVAAEAAVAAQRHAERPYVLAVQPTVVDRTRAPAGRHVLWAYAHVPQGSTLNVSNQIKDQIERFAPGFRDVILEEHIITAAEQQLHNRNYIGGDISGGATTAWRFLARPVARWNPYGTPLDGVYLCSASTPPGQAVHGMCGVHAASRALRQRFGISVDPLTLVS